MKKPQHIEIVKFLNRLTKACPKTEPVKKTGRLYFRNNPDGTIRWIWPASLRQPLFLKFYNTPSRRARLIKASIRFLFRLRLQRFFASGMVTMNIGNTESLGFDLSKENWALFTGTPGVHRTALIYQENMFFKIPEGLSAASAVIHEYQSLKNRELYLFRNIELPRACLNEQVLCITDMGNKGRQTGTLTSLHWGAIEELSRTWSSTTSIKLLSQWQNMQATLTTLKEQPAGRIPVNLVSKLRLLGSYINPAQIIPASVSHGDFTPWNIFVKKNKLGIIDWELSRNTAPCLTDVFHFLYQQTSLVEHKGYRVLRQRIADALEHETAKQLIAGKKIDVELHHRLYLLFTATKYLGEYSTQQQWHPQVKKSINMWNEAVNHHLLALNACTPRQLLLQDIFDFLQDHDYAALKWKGGAPAALSIESDIDLCLRKETAAKLYRFMKRHPLVKRIACSRRSFMANYGVVLKDGAFLSVDAIWTFKRKNIVMMDVAGLLAGASFNAFGVKIPAVQDDFTYTWLFYLLNGQGLPEQYRKIFTFFSRSLQQQMEENIPWIAMLGLRSYHELFDYTLKNHHKVATVLQQQPANKGWRQLKNKMAYCLDAIREHRPRKGFTITFSGVDGAGKSTVIENIRHQIQKRYRRKTVVLRHRPALLPMLSAWKEGRAKAERMAAQRLPRQGSNKSTLSSLLRFAYYFSDYLIGQFAVYLRYVCRGYVVIYDRYYFDFINDGKRSNILLPAFFTRSLYRLLLKPKFNFFLYADAETIVNRKKELDTETIYQLTGRYLDLFRRLGKQHRHSSYVTVENNKLPETLELIHTYINPAIL